MISLVDPGDVFYFLLCSFGVFFTIKQAFVQIRRRKIRKRLGLFKAKSLPLLDPFFGTDLSVTIFNQIRRSELLEGLDKRFLRFGNTHSFQLGLTSIVATCDPDNIKTITMNAIDFPVGDVRRKGLSILHGQGIFAVEGSDWHRSRSALRPSFTKGKHDDVAVLETHFQDMLNQIALSNYSVDMQDVYHRFTMNTATQYFFGTSPRESGQGRQIERLLESIDYVNQTVYLALVFGSHSPISLWRWWQTKKKMRVIHAFVDQHVKRVLSPDFKSYEVNNRRYIFLDELSKSESGKDPIFLRDQVLTSMLGGKDTTASLLTHVTFELARNPIIWAKLRVEIGKLDLELVDMKTIRNLKYVRFCLLEALRLYTVVPINMRSASADTMLPVGGGVDGNNPIQIPKNTILWLGMFSMHRRKDIWGDDADQFNPDRWENLDPGPAFVPFGSGPRTCLGQQFAFNEASFALTRLVQTFHELEPLSDAPWKEKVAITLGSGNGCKIRLHRYTSSEFEQ
ncbi:cytochrome P450 [Microthyrium microscopicum]|uniref:Cytochrome P450 n=1 Tax=Microthyrium microscopicum TaxID=703497 RepID=A0A6A6UE35_9PEZI|nr:cytochrome P450 [Microthyrium microscopicum]